MIKVKEVREYFGKPEVVREVDFKDREYFESYENLCNATNRLVGFVIDPPDGMLKSIALEVL